MLENLQVIYYTKNTSIIQENFKDITITSMKLCMTHAIKLASKGVTVFNKVVNFDDCPHSHKDNLFDSPEYLCDIRDCRRPFKGVNND